MEELAVNFNESVNRAQMSTAAASFCFNCYTASNECGNVATVATVVVVADKRDDGVVECNALHKVIVSLI